MTGYRYTVSKRTLLIAAFAGCMGALLSSQGFSVSTWQFWAFMLVMIGYGQVCKMPKEAQ